MEELERRLAGLNGQEMLVMKTRTNRKATIMVMVRETQERGGNTSKRNRVRKRRITESKQMEYIKQNGVVETASKICLRMDR